MKLRLFLLLPLVLVPLACGSGASEAERVEQAVFEYFQASSNGEWEKTCGLASPKWAGQMALMAQVDKVMDRGQSKDSFSFRGGSMDCPRVLQKAYGDVTGSPETDAAFKETEIEGLDARSTVTLKGYRPPGADAIWPEVTYEASLEKSEGRWKISSLLVDGLSDASR